MKKDRPLSPHLGIYKPQISSVFSIMHRLSGLYLFVGFVFLGWWIGYVSYSENDIMHTPVWRFFQTIVGRLIMAVWSYSFFFHMCNGMRYLLWGTGRAFGVSNIGASAGIAMFITLMLWGFSLIPIIGKMLVG